MTKSTVLRAEIGDDARVGPFAVLGPGTTWRGRRRGAVHPPGGGLRRTRLIRDSTRDPTGSRRGPGRVGAPGQVVWTIITAHGALSTTESGTLPSTLRTPTMPLLPTTMAVHEPFPEEFACSCDNTGS